MTLSPTVKYLGPWDNGNFLSLYLKLKFAFLYNNAPWRTSLDRPRKISSKENTYFFRYFKHYR